MNWPSSNKIFRVLSIFFVAGLFTITAFAEKNFKFKTMHVAELASLIEKGASSVEIFDANVESTRTHVGIIPGAHLLSSSKDFDVTKELPSDKNKKLVFYCANPQCTASHEAANKAINNGYKDVSVMVDGIYGWRDAKQKLEKVKGAEKVTANATSIEPKAVSQMLSSQQAIVLDVREGQERHEIIENVKWMPMSKAADEAQFKEFEKTLPKDKTIVVHCAAGVRAKKMADRLAADGFKTAFFKGPDQWKAEGLPLVQGPAK